MSLSPAIRPAGDDKPAVDRPRHIAFGRWTQCRTKDVEDMYRQAAASSRDHRYRHASHKA